MDKHRGLIGMRSRLEQPGSAGGHGTVFSLWLPVVADAPAQAVIPGD
jgi:signal transduction histidine kinase